MITRKVLLSSLALSFAFGAGLLAPSFVGAQLVPVSIKDLQKADLQGYDGREFLMQLVEIVPNGSIPWHIHPEGYEITYQLSGSLTLEVDGQGAKTIKAGDAFNIAPNIAHRAKNESASEPVKLLVVRLKPKDKPVASLVQR